MLTISDLFLVGAVLLAAGITAAFLRKARLFPILFWSLVSLYALGVLGVTLFPIPYQEAGHLAPVPNNFVPFAGIASILKMGVTRNALAQIGGNILLAVPYGVLVDWLVTRKWLRRILPVLFPVAVEVLQLSVGMLIGAAYRSFDVDDVLLNALGAYLGLLFSKIFLRRLRRMVRRKLAVQRR